MKQVGLKVSDPFDEIYTPIEGVYPLLSIIPKNWVIWESCYGDGDLKRHLEYFGYTVIGSKDEDFFKTSKDNFDIIVTNPPYSNKRDFIDRAFQFEKPFAFLVPLTTLEGKKSMELFNEKRIQLVIPNRRINFIPGKKGSWFAVMWLTYGLALPKDITYFDMRDAIYNK